MSTSKPPQQSAAMLGMFRAAQASTFVLPNCLRCGHLFYPPQAWCPRCLHGETGYAPDSGLATVLSMTALAISFEAAWKRRLPTHVACVRTLSGVSLFALADGAMAEGTEVRVSVRAAAAALPALLTVRATEAEPEVRCGVSTLE